MDNYDKNIITKIINHNLLFEINNNFLSGFMKFGLLPLLLWFVFIITRWEETTLYFSTAYFLGVLWVIIGPLLILFYDGYVLPEFCVESRELIKNPDQIKELGVKYDHFFSHKWGLTVFPWMVLGALLIYFDLNFFKTVGFHGFDDVLFLFFLVFLFEALFLTGIGFTGVLTTQLFIKDFIKLDLKIDPLHPDNLGGMSIVGNYAIKTTILFSSGSLFFPFGFQLASTNSVAANCFYAMVILFIGFILLSFIYPTLKVNLRASEARDNKLNELRRKYHQLREENLELKKNTTQEQQLYELKRQNIRDEYFDYQSIKLYPLDIDIIIQLSGSIILPIVFLTFEVVFQNYIEQFI